MSICPVCEEVVVRGTPRNANGGRPADRTVGWATQIDPQRLDHQHKDGTHLCPVKTTRGYQPALPKRVK